MSNNNSIARDMRTFLNSWADRPKDFALEKLSLSPPALMFQPLAGAKVLKKYIDGSYIGTWPFAICYRVGIVDTSIKLSAYDILEKVADWITSGVLPALSDSKEATKIEQTSTPSQIAVYEDGTEDYQVLFALEYKQRKV